MTKKNHKPGDPMPPWTSWLPAEYPEDAQDLLDSIGGKIRYSFINSRYQVDLEPFDHPLFGQTVKVGIKDHWRTARHDWRDFQRIKNELVGPQFDAIELYPAEDRLVDTANQYYMFVFLNTRIPIGWNDRLVAEGNYLKGRQRPWDPGARPTDCLTQEQVQERMRADIIRLRKERSHDGTVGMAATSGGEPGTPDDTK